MDYDLSNKHTYSNILSKSSKILSNSKDDYKQTAQRLFYYIDPNEYEARYHECYMEFDDFLKDKKSLIKKPGDVATAFDVFLDTRKDKSHLYYFVKDFSFEWLLNGNKRKINQILHSISNKDFYPKEYNNNYRFIETMVKKAFKSTFNRYSEEEMRDIEKTKKTYEKMINKNLKKYNKKFFKIVPAMVEKYCDSY